MTDTTPPTRLHMARHTSPSHGLEWLRLSWLLCLSVGLWASHLAHAADMSASAAAALKILSVPLPEEIAHAPATAHSQVSPAPAGHTSITVQKGESIDAVIRRGLPGLPLKEDFMRQALARANPSIFPKGQTYPVRPGTVLVLPSHEELRRLLVAQYPNAEALFQKTPSEGSSGDTATGLEKRRWVRFP